MKYNGYFTGYVGTREDSFPYLDIEHDSVSFGCPVCGANEWDMVYEAEVHERISSWDGLTVQVRIRHDEPELVFCGNLDCCMAFSYSSWLLAMTSSWAWTAPDENGHDMGDVNPITGTPLVPMFLEIGGNARRATKEEYAAMIEENKNWVQRKRE